MVVPSDGGSGGGFSVVPSALLPAARRFTDIAVAWQTSAGHVQGLLNSAAADAPGAVAGAAADAAKHASDSMYGVAAHTELAALALEVTEKNYTGTDTAARTHLGGR